MSAAVALQPAGACKTRAKKPDLIRQLDVEYWVSIPLEIIEKRIRGRNVNDRVYYAIVRCSFAPHFLSPFAIKPRLQNRGIEEWINRMEQRISEGRAFYPGELNDEISATDEDGKLMPLTQTDLAKITGLSKSQVSKAIKALRNEGWIDRGSLLKVIAKPAAPCPINSDPTVSFEENSALASVIGKISHLLGIRVSFEGNTPEQQELVLKLLKKRFEDTKARLTEVRKEARQELRKDFEEHGILIKVKFQQRYVKSHRIGRAEGLASDPHGLNRVLVSLVDRFQRQMLVDLQALFAFVPGNQLNLCVGEALGRKVRQHLMAEQVRVNRLRQAGLLAVALHDLLDSARGERPEPPSLK
jgi:Crp-like helix-turn-helix domain